MKFPARGRRRGKKRTKRTNLEKEVEKTREGRERERGRASETRSKEREDGLDELQLAWRDGARRRRARIPGTESRPMPRPMGRTPRRRPLESP
eukprot:2839912-Pleurochrysis_carterae.AAC.5